MNHLFKLLERWAKFLLATGAAITLIFLWRGALDVDTINRQADQFLKQDIRSVQNREDLKIDSLTKELDALRRGDTSYRARSDKPLQEDEVRISESEQRFDDARHNLSEVVAQWIVFGALVAAAGAILEFILIQWKHHNEGKGIKRSCLYAWICQTMFCALIFFLMFVFSSELLEAGRVWWNFIRGLASPFI